MYITKVLFFISFSLLNTFGRVEPYSRKDTQRAFDTGNCNFYIDELESSIPCGNQGYAVSYGYKYCQAFTQSYNNFDSMGRTYINGTRQCLIESLYPHISSANMTCDKIKKLAFETHATCYVENGFCEMLAGNILSLYSVYDIKNDFLLTKDFDLVSKQMLVAASVCAQKTIEAVQDKVTTFVKLLPDILKEHLPNTQMKWNMKEHLKLFQLFEH